LVSFLENAIWLQGELIVLAPENHFRTWRSKMANRSVSLLGFVLLAVGLVSCHNKSEEDLPVSMPNVISLNGAGATFPYPIYSKWVYEYKKLYPGVEINYQPIGSGGGIKQFTDGTVDFGASDGPMTDEQLADFQKNHNATALHFPAVLGADVPSYNIPGVTEELKFTPEALAGIFLGEIKKWNDPEIARENPTVKLPAADIVESTSVSVR
jgi:ABC-type phosphate transport system substrate-binding protein